jgi:hypothetical protein
VASRYQNPGIIPLLLPAPVRLTTRRRPHAFQTS